MADLPRRIAGKAHIVGSLAELEDQLCIAEGEMIATAAGPVPIERVRVGDLVHTRIGLRRVVKAMKTGDAEPILSLRLSNGAELRATPNHPIYTLEHGFIRLDAIACGDSVIFRKEEPKWKPRNWNWMAGFTGAIRTAAANLLVAILSASPVPASAYTTAIYGRSTRGQSQSEATSTTPTRTRSTTNSQTSSASPRKSTPRATLTSFAAILSTWRGYARSLWRGTGQRKAGSGTGSTPSNLPSGRFPNRSGPARTAGRPFSASRPARRLFASARLGVLALSPIGRIATWLKPLARFAAARFFKANIDSRLRLALVSVERVSENSVGKVWNLQVEGQPEFFANGILCHNCTWEPMSGQASPDRLS